MGKKRIVKTGTGSNEEVAKSVIAFKESMNTEVLEKATKVEEIGYQNYLNLKK